MRARVLSFLLCLFLAFLVTGCNKPPAADNSTDAAANDTPSSADSAKDSKAASEHREHARKETKRETLTVPSGTGITISLGSAIGSKLSQPGQTFNGSVARDVMAGSAVAIPQGTNISGTVTDAKPLGKFKGGAILQVRLDSINLHGAEIPVQTAAKSFTEKGKGKRTAVLTGGGAAVGGIIGALAGGGKGAAIGAAAGAGAGAGGSALTGNKDIVLPAESDIAFELSAPLEIRR